MTDNKLIAEFMGVKPTILGDEITYEMYGIIDCIEDGVDEQHFFLEEELMFHTSWDWLKDVVDEIEQVNEGVPEQMMDVSLYSTIDEVYEAVVEFIKIHNDESNFLCGSCGEECSEYTYSEDRDVDECNDCKTSNDEQQ